jgi:hypothetical protein
MGSCCRTNRQGGDWFLGGQEAALGSEMAASVERVASTATDPVRWLSLAKPKPQVAFSLERRSGFNIREETMLRRLIPLTLMLAGANAVLADDMKMPTNSGDLKWGPAPALPKGAEITVLSGDPSKDGLYVVRLKMPDGYKIPAHNHPTTEYATVISGNFHLDRVLPVAEGARRIEGARHHRRDPRGAPRA